MIYIFIFFMIFSIPLHAMVEVSLDEGTPLNTAQSRPMIPALQMTDEDENQRSALFDGTRRFYDRESHNKVWKDSLKECACETLICTLGMGSCGIVGGAGLAALSKLTGAAKFLFLTVSGGAVCGGSACAINSLLLPTYYRHENADDPARVVWENPLEIPNELHAAVDSEAVISCPKQVLETLITRAKEKNLHGRSDNTWLWIKRLFTCYYDKERQLITSLEAQLDAYNEAPIVRTDDNVDITHKELCVLIDDLGSYAASNDLARDYAKLILLAHNGWISFTKSAKYTARCEMKYFDVATLPGEAKRWYGLQYGPPVYLPATEEDLIAYYRFNADPYYQIQDDTHQRDNN